MKQNNRPKDNIELDFEVTSELLRAISCLLIESTRENGSISNDILLPIAMNFDTELDSLEHCFSEMSDLVKEEKS